MKLKKVLALLLTCAMLMGSAAFAAEEDQLLIAPNPAAADAVEEVEGPDSQVSIYVDSISGRAMLSLQQSGNESYGFKIQCNWPNGTNQDGVEEYYFFDLRADVDDNTDMTEGLPLTYSGEVYVNGVEKETISGNMLWVVSEEPAKLIWMRENDGERTDTFVYSESRSVTDNPVVMVVPSLFNDVDALAYYSRAVNWAAENGVTTGRGGGIFDPEATVTRAEAVTFLWRMASEPAPTQTETFDDVVNDPNKVWYETAVQWAVEQGITNGTGSGFSPYVTCDRAMILTMLYRMEGRPWDEALAAEVPETATSLDDLGNGLIQAIVENIRTGHPFTDVEEGDYFEIPVLWAFVNGILDTNQVAEDAEAAGATTACVRGEMAWFLYRAVEYEKAAKEAQDAYDQWNTPPEPIQVGTIEKTVVMDKDGIKITADSIEYDENLQEAVLRMTVENGSKKQVYADTYGLYVNTYFVSASASIPVEEEGGWTSYDSVIVPAGETKEFQVSLNDLREKGITSVQEIEIKMGADDITVTEDGYEYGEAHIDEYVTLKTSLYDGSASYDQQGTVVYDKDGLKVLITKAANSEYNGPQIAVYVYNGTKEEVDLQLADLTLDGEVYESFYGSNVEPGKRSVDSVYIDYDYENVPTPEEATLTFRTVTYDEETWDPIPVLTFDSVTVTFDAQ